jgi:hypothetical protein
MQMRALTDKMNLIKVVNFLDSQSSCSALTAKQTLADTAFEKCTAPLLDEP